MRHLYVTLSLAACVAFVAIAEEPKGDGFVSLTDGKTLKGWHVSAKSGHSGASKHRSGGSWVIQDGAIVGSQDIPGNGGILLTDDKYGDFEVSLEMNNDFGPDSGLFLRSTDDGKCYQAMIDYHSGGNVMGIYGEGLGGKPHLRNYQFIDAPDKIEVLQELDGVKTPVPFPLTVEKWPTFWKHGQWNELRARVVGNPPHITTWINGMKIMEWTETTKRLDDTGYIGVQVHGGGDFTKQFVRYRNVKVKTIKN